MMKYPPPGFLAAIIPAGESYDAFPGGSFDEIIDCLDFNVCLTIFRGAKQIRDPESGIIIVQTGYILGGKGLPLVLNLYRRLGSAMAAEIDGLYMLLVIDPKARKVLVITDRSGSHSVFTRGMGECTVISTSVNALAYGDLELDPSAVVWFLTNGRFNINRTLFKEIRRLETSSCYEFSPGIQKQNIYWRLNFTDEYAGKSEAALKAELSELLVEAVRRSIPGNSTILVSLSKGYDVTGVLGIMLEKLGLSGVETFSYGLREHEPRTDASLSRELALQLGVAHRFIPSYNGDVCGVLEKNISWWGCASEFCDEIDVWNTLEEEAAGRNHILFTGELDFGWTDAVMKTTDEMLNICLVRTMHNYQFLGSLLTSKQKKFFQENVEEEKQALLDRFPNSYNFQQCSDFFFMDQRKITSTLPWREYYAGRVYEVRCPFMGKDLLNFILKLPDHWRDGKSLYIKTINEMFPKIYSTPRAESGGARADWESELHRNRDAVAERFILDGAPTALDEFISPDVMMKMLMMQGNPALSRPSGIEKALKIPGRVANKVLGYKQHNKKQLGSHLVLMRCLLIRGYLKNLLTGKPADDLSIDW